MAYTRDYYPSREQQVGVLRATAQLQRPRLQVAVQRRDGDQAKRRRGRRVVDQPGVMRKKSVLDW